MPIPIPEDCSALDLPLRTERLELMPLSREKFEEIYELCAHPDTCRYIRPAMTREQVGEHIDTRQRPWFFEDGKWYSLAVCEIGHSRVIGEVVFRMESRADRRAEIGYRFHPNAWGRGYALEAMRGLCDTIVPKLDLHKLVAYCVPENAASIRLLEKLGMQREGLLREHDFVFGKWKDRGVYGLLCRDYDK